MIKYKTVYADPPWDYKNKGTRSAAAKNYPTMTDEELQDLIIPSIIDEDAHLYLWSPVDHIREALQLMAAWGFSYKTMIAWVKFTKHGKVHFGMGNYFRGAWEACLFGVHGKMRTLSKSQRNVLFLKKPPLHSAKPPKMYEVIEKHSPAPRIELFARESREGWTSLGYDVDGEDIRDSLIRIQSSLGSAKK